MLLPAGVLQQEGVARGLEGMDYRFTLQRARVASAFSCSCSNSETFQSCVGGGLACPLGRLLFGAFGLGPKCPSGQKFWGAPSHLATGEFSLEVMEGMGHLTCWYVPENKVNQKTRLAPGQTKPQAPQTPTTSTLSWVCGALFASEVLAKLTQAKKLLSHA
eukprot:1052603-Amphidinium_carterae.1